MNRKFFNTAFIVFLAMIVCKLFAFLQEIVVAGKLGATATGDAFNMVFGIQQTIYPMLAIGISQIFYPEYKSLLSKKEKEKADVLASYSIVFFTVFSLVIVVLLLFFSNAVVNFVAPGFNTFQHYQTTEMIRISAISYIFVCAASVVGCILMANGHFFISEVRAAFSHIPIIIAAIVFYDTFGIKALAISIVFAGALRLLIQIPFLEKDYSFSLKPKLDNKYLKKLIKLLPHSIVSSGISQLNTLIDRMLASDLPVGSVSCLNYGTRVFSVLRELIANIVSTSSYPQIIEYVSCDKKNELSNFLYDLLNMLLLITIPVTFYGIAYSKEIIDVIFVRGKFTLSMGLITSEVFSFYLLSLPFSSLLGIINNVYFANKNTKFPMIINSINLTLNIILNIVLVQSMGVGGLALATTISTVFCVCYSLFNIRKHLRFKYKKTMTNIVKIIFATLISLIVSIIFTNMIVVDSSILKIIVVIIVALPTYIFLIRMTKIDIYEKLLALLKNRIEKNF